MNEEDYAFIKVPLPVTYTENYPRPELYKRWLEVNKWEVLEVTDVFNATNRYGGFTPDKNCCVPMVIIVVNIAKSYINDTTGGV